MKPEECTHAVVVRMVTSWFLKPHTYSWKCRVCGIAFKPVTPGGALDPAVNPFA